MERTSKFIKKMNDYKKCMRVINCANYVYLDEMDNFEFKKISKYNKSKYLYNKIIADFRLANKLIDKQDIFNAAAILRTIYENIIYVIATSYDKKIKITIKTSPRDLRKIIEENYYSIFTEYFKKDDFKMIYNYLCKIVHPCSIKELISYMSKTVKYKDYLLSNLKYIMILIEYIYLNFLNKKVGNEESIFDLNFMNLCTYVNLMNISYFISDIKDSKTLIKRYFYYDTDTKYTNNNQETLKVIYESFINKKELIEEDIKELTKTLDYQIKENKYTEIINEILSGKTRK